MVTFIADTWADDFVKNLRRKKNKTVINNLDILYTNLDEEGVKKCSNTVYFDMKLISSLCTNVIIYCEINNISPINRTVRHLAYLHNEVQKYPFDSRRILKNGLMFLRDLD